jgi:hypothetical protein
MRTRRTQRYFTIMYQLQLNSEAKRRLGEQLMVLKAGIGSSLIALQIADQLAKTLTKGPFVNLIKHILRYIVIICYRNTNMK